MLLVTLHRQAKTNVELAFKNKDRSNAPWALANKGNRSATAPAFPAPWPESEAQISVLRIWGNGERMGETRASSSLSIASIRSFSCLGAHFRVGSRTKVGSDKNVRGCYAGVLPCSWPAGRPARHGQAFQCGV